MSRGRRAAVVLVALVIAGCGAADSPKKGGLVWDGEPTVRASPSGAVVLTGRVRNDSGQELSIRAPDLKVIDGRGRPIRSAAVFVSTFVRSLYPHNSGAGSDPSHYPEAEQQRVGYLAKVEPDASVPLTISWRKPARGRAVTRIAYGKSYLPVPR